MEEPSGVEERLRIFLIARGLLVGIMNDGGEAAVARSAERYPLDRVRAEPSAVIHLAAQLR